MNSIFILFIWYLICLHWNDFSLYLRLLLAEGRVNTVNGVQVDGLLIILIWVRHKGFMLLSWLRGHAHLTICFQEKKTCGHWRFARSHDASLYVYIYIYTNNAN